MSPDSNEAWINPSRRNVAVIGAVMLITIGIGRFLAWDASDTSILITWIWFGIAVSIVYLLFQIATNVEKLRSEI